MGGEYMLPVSAERREGAGIVAGQEIEVDLALDTAPREVTLVAPKLVVMPDDSVRFVVPGDVDYPTSDPRD